MTDELTIGDVLFLENRNRKYAPDIIEMRGAYNVSNTDFDLTQFGIFLTDDTIFMSFHLNENVERLGRKLMPGDVLELPHLREYHALDEDTPAINRFYVVEDGSHSAEGYGPRWWSHVWRVRAKQMPASTEYQDILDRVAGDGQTLESLPPGDDDDCCEVTVEDGISDRDNLEEITDAIIEEAAANVPCDPLHYDAEHLYVYIDPNTREHQLIWFKTGDGIPPNGFALAGSGATFPDTLVDGDYYLRTDFDSPLLYQKQGTTFKKIEVDTCQLPWTGANQVLDSFIENENITTNDDGSTEPERQALSKTVLARPKTEDWTPPLRTPDTENGVEPDTNIFTDDWGDEFE